MKVATSDKLVTRAETTLSTARVKFKASRFRSRIETWAMATHPPLDTPGLTNRPRTLREQSAVVDSRRP